MKSNFVLKAVALTVVGAGLAYGGYWAGTHRSMLATAPPTETASAAAGDKIDPKTGRKVLYWHDPMVPVLTIAQN